MKHFTALGFKQARLISLLPLLAAFFAFTVSASAQTYCTASNGAWWDCIGRVQFGSIDNTTTGTTGYADFTYLSTSLEYGVDYEMIVTNPNQYYADSVTAWCDWNHDFDFTDAGEEYVITGEGSGIGYQFKSKIRVPADALSGTTRMRVRLMDAGSNGSITKPVPCGSLEYSDAEDYSVYVIPPPPDAAVTAIIPPASPYMEGVLPVQMTLTNMSMSDLTSVKIHWSVNGVEQALNNWTGTLKKDEKADVALGSYNFSYSPDGPFNPFTLVVWVTNTNGLVGTDGDASNDTKILNTSPVIDDAGISGFTKPSGQFGPGMQQVWLKIKNYGSRPLTSAKINWSVDGLMQGVKAWAGFLKKGEEAELLVGSVNIQFKTPLAAFKFNAYTTDPNGIIDLITTNDAAPDFFSAPALVAGSYTVGGSTAHFANITDFANYVSATGIIGSGNMDITINKGTYNEQFMFNNLGSSNKFIIHSASNKPEDVVYTYPVTTAKDYVMGFKNCTNFEINGITLIATNGGAGRALSVESSNNIEFKNFLVRGVQNAPRTTDFSTIFAINSHHINFSGMDIRDGSYAINFSAASMSDPGVELSNNTINGFTYAGIKFDMPIPSTTVKINNNIINGNTTIKPFFGIISINGSSVQGNQITGLSGSLAGDITESGIKVVHTSLSSGTIVNNKLTNSFNVNGIYVSASNHEVNNNNMTVFVNQPNLNLSGIYTSGNNNINKNYVKAVGDVAGTGLRIISGVNAAGYITNNQLAGRNAYGMVLTNSAGVTAMYNSVVTKSTQYPALSIQGGNLSLMRNIFANTGSFNSFLYGGGTVYSKENNISSAIATDLNIWKAQFGDLTTTDVPMQFVSDFDLRIASYDDKLLFNNPLELTDPAAIAFEATDGLGNPRKGYFMGFAGIELSIVVVEQPEPVLLCAGSKDVKLKVTAYITYGAKTKYQWELDDRILPGETNPTLLISELAYTNSGTYRCKVYGPASTADGVYTSETLVYALHPTEVLQQPVSQSVELGSDVKFETEVHIKGMVPPFFQHKYQWWLHRSGQDILVENNDKIAGATTPILTIRNAGLAEAAYNEDYYILEVEGLCGKIYSEKVTLEVAPTIAFKNVPGDVLTCEGNDATFAVGVSNDFGLPLDYKWYLNNVLLVDDARITGSTTASINVKSVNVADKGYYRCSVIPNGNASKAINIAAVLDVYTKPVVKVVGDVFAVTVLQDSTISLEVTATDHAPFTYQWQFNGADITDATTPLFEKIASLSDAGNYTCKVTNECGVTTSDVIAVDVKKGGIVSVADDKNSFGLEVMPNPATETATIRFNSESSVPARVSIMDMKGSEVAVLFNGASSIGMNNYALNANGLSSGVYFVKVVLGAQVTTARLTIVK